MESILQVPDETLSEDFRGLNGKRCRLHTTAGGGACAIHSVFGNLTAQGYFKQNARNFVLQTFTTSPTTFKTRLNHLPTLLDLSRVLWQDLVKPCAAQHAGLESRDLTIRHEGILIRAEVIPKNGMF